MFSSSYWLLTAGLVILASATSSRAESYVGRVVRVGDGDTITVLDNTNTQHKVRLAGIDSPEKAQAFGNAAKQNLSRWVFSQTVTIDTNKADRYQREVGKVMLNGVDINLEQVKAGLAWHYKKYEREQSAMDRHVYAGAEDTARAKRVGLWAEPTPVPPWEFRHNKNSRP